VSRLIYRALVILVFVSGITPAQPLGLNADPLEVGGLFCMETVGGPPHQTWHIGFDASPGPVSTPIGTIQLGFTSQFFLIDSLQLDAWGAGQITGAAGNASLGQVIYSQAAANDPATFSGARLSLPFAGGVHPAQPSSSQTMLTLGDDDWTEVDLGMPFPFYGTTWTTCHVCSNGLLTFGGGTIDPTEQISDFMAGLPKIAVLWDDLSPQIQGTVHVESGAGWFHVAWTNVPQFWVADDNCAEATLWADGRIKLHWPTIDLTDGMIGLSPGNWMGTPTFADYTATPTGQTFGSGPILEQFLPSTKLNDLSGQMLTFYPALAGGYEWIR